MYCFLRIVKYLKLKLCRIQYLFVTNCFQMFRIIRIGHDEDEADIEDESIVL